MKTTIMTKNETLWVSHIDPQTKEVSSFITSNKDRSMYYFYSVSQDGLAKKIGKGSNPSVLEEKYIKNGSALS